MPGATSIANPTTPLQAIIPSYLYQQYADDVNLQAFVDAYNSIAQGYLDWFNTTPLAVYTLPGVSGELLDWIGVGIYGVERPVFSTLSTRFLTDAINQLPTDSIAMDGAKQQSSGTAVTSNDDFYKRTLTWATYIGDGRICNAMTLRKRIARFLYGKNGGDVTLSQAQNVQIAVQASPLKYLITLPSAANPASSFFQEAFNSGILAFPFQLAATVSIV